jgi:hypothetical protein
MNQTRKSVRASDVFRQASVVLPVRSFLQAFLIAALLQVPAASQLPPQNGGGKEQASGEIATIIQSPSTNTPGFKIVIHEDGSATEEVSQFRGPSNAQSQTRQYPPGSIDTNTLHRLLTTIGDVSKIPTGFCPKSVSFGTRTQIAYNGKVSGDLQCVRAQASETDPSLLHASQELSKFVQNIVKQARVPAGRRMMIFKSNDE